MASIIAIFLAILKVVFNLFVFWVYGWIAGEILNCKGSRLRNFIVGFIGDHISVLIIVIVFKVIEVLQITILEELLLLSNIVLSLILPVFGSVLVMCIYKSIVECQKHGNS
ncbi:MAG: hypothetical protein IJO27_02900 [Bacilli bacterium]|nr:hypothetical protein [Bacilli bacterium]